jgi:ankyrin repeat protein
MEPNSAPPSAKESTFLIAVQNGRLETIGELLKENSSLVGARTESGKTPLHLAVENNNEAVVQVLLANGADPEIADNDGWKPLAIAAKEGPLLLPIITHLVNYGANVEAVNSQLQLSALHLCVEAGFYEVAKELLDNGAQVDFRDSHERTPLFRAISNGTTELIKLLLEYGADSANPADGVTAKGLAADNHASPRLLTTHRLLRGPQTSIRPASTRILGAQNSAPLGDADKMMACHAFEANITEFYIGESEMRISRAVSVFDALYGAEVNDMFSAEAYDAGKASFRWYHFPANNVSYLI